MKGVIMYHKIKIMKETSSVREIATELKISPTTVQKYASFDIQAASECLIKRKRDSQFLRALPLIERQLGLFPHLKATKLLRLIKAEYPEITSKVRALRNFLATIKDSLPQKDERIYEPVIDTPRQGQVQVDGGEAMVEFSNNKRQKVYFATFTYSYSKPMYVSFQNRAFTTDDYIRAHLELFRHFGYVFKEGVYDQSKLVVIKEHYREISHNMSFEQFATKCGFLIRACVARDPESKGKVERAVGYVKSDFLYGEVFKDMSDLIAKSKVWLNNVANVRFHGTTGRQPAEMFSEEIPFLKPYTLGLDDRNIRHVDKTGLIYYKNNMYSVPYQYQRKSVLIDVASDILRIYDLSTNALIAEHNISILNKLNKKPEHYPSRDEKIKQRIQETLETLSGVNFAEILIDRLKSDNPEIIVAQLHGVRLLANRYSVECWNDVIEGILALSVIRVSSIGKMLEANYLRTRLYRNNTFGSGSCGQFGSLGGVFSPAAGGRTFNPTQTAELTNQANTSSIGRDLNYYERKIKNAT